MTILHIFLVFSEKLNFIMTPQFGQMQSSKILDNMTKPNNTEVAPMKLIIKSVILCACTFCIVQLECIMFDTSISFYQLSKYLYTKRPEFFQYHFSFLENISNYRHVLFLRVKKPCFDNPKNFGTQERILRLAKINLPCFVIKL